MQKKIVFIIPHFGKFNNYFQIWLHTCRYNPTIDWLIFTDDKSPYEYPDNVKVTYTSFEMIVKKIQEQFDFDIQLKDPYHLCEFKVTYGEVFAEHIKEYDFWGYCDTDLIWGNLREHINDEILKSYAKISWRGHLTLFRNTKKINALYRSAVDGTLFYRHAFTNNTQFPFWFEERMINSIFLESGEKVYTKLKFAEPRIRDYNFSLLHFPVEVDFKNEHQVFLWSVGNLYRIYTSENRVYFESFAYIHLLKRPMKIESSFGLADKFIIAPNRFITYSAISSNLIDSLTRKRIYFSYFLYRLSYKYVLGKMKYFRNKRIFESNYQFMPSRIFAPEIPCITLKDSEFKDD